MLESAFSHYSFGAWTFLLDHVWQTTLFAGLIVAASFILRNAPARIRYAVWSVACLKFLLPSALFLYLAKLAGLDISSVLLSVAWASGDPLNLLDKQQHIFLVGESSGAIFNQARFLIAAAAIVWISGSITFLFLWVRRQFAFHKQLQECETVCEGREFEILDSSKKKIGLNRNIQLLQFREMTEPGVWGIWNPSIVFSAEMSSRLTDSELETVFLHELAHISRWDNLFSTLQMMICTMFWFHPVVWWIDRQMLAERERACDDRVMECGGTSRVYASSLVKVLSFGLGVRLAGVSCAGGSDLKKRIQHITSNENRRKLALIHWIVLAGLVLVLAIASIAAVDIGDCERTTLRKQLSAELGEQGSTSNSACSVESLSGMYRSAKAYLNLTRELFSNLSGN